MSKNTFTISAAAIAVAAALGSASANAATAIDKALSADPPSTMVIRFADLNLSTIEGAEALYGRLQQAARIVCRPVESLSLSLAEAHEGCMQKAMGDAVASVNRSLVSRLHELHTKGSSVAYTRLAKTSLE